MRYESFECSSAQKRQFMLRQLVGPTTLYNIPTCLTIEGKFDQARFAAAFKKLIERHESLRTAFAFSEGEVIQRVYDEVEFHLTYSEGNGQSYDDLLAQFSRPFDLSMAPLFRVELVKVQADLHFLLFDIDHIITDGFSNGIIVKDLIDLYSGQTLSQVDYQYVDFVMWQNDLLKGEAIKAEEEFWLNAFSGEIPVLNLPTDFPRPGKKSHRGSNIRVAIGEELTARVKELAQQNGATPFMVLLAVYNLLLARYSRQEEIIVGTPVVGRQHEDLFKTVGLFVNTLALRNYPAGEKTFVKFLEEVKGSAFRAFKNQNYQFEMLVDKLKLQRDLSRNPLFDVMFVFQNVGNTAITIEGLTFTPYQFEIKTAKFDLNLEVHEKNNGLSLNWQYATELFSKETVLQLTRHFEHLLAEVVENPEQKLADFTLTLEEERAEILTGFNQTGTEYPREKTFHQIFEEQVAKTPDNIALVFCEREYSYAELNVRANQLARLLRAKGVQPDELVGILLSRSAEMVIGILGVLKAGAAFLPMDANYPGERIEFMLEDSKARILLTEKGLQDKANFAGTKICLNEPEIYTGDATNLAAPAAAENLCYVIYTSGSTGKPKGVLIEHRNLVNYMCWFNDKIQITEKDSTIVLASYSFDGVYTNFCSPLMTGGTLHIITEQTFADPNLLIEYIHLRKITHIKGTPSLFNAIITSAKFAESGLLASLRFIMIGGEEVRAKDLAKFKERYPAAQLMNHYGPTEATIGCLSILLTEEAFPAFLERPVIGKPHANMKAYVLSAANQVMPVGVPGELCIAGEGIARGYLNRPELTAEKFVRNPFNPKERMYRTGDLARWTFEGNIEFLGRIDEQVKIRGYRIELAEIEVALKQHPTVRETVVIDRTDSTGSKYICAYIVTDAELSVAELRAFLSTKLPNYMIPSYFVRIDSIPLRVSGKIDRALLPLPDGSIKTGTEYVAPKTTVEKKLVQLWSQVLGLDSARIGVSDSFFDLGGNSLKMMELIELINREFGTNLKLIELFNYTTIEQLVTLLDGGKEDSEIMLFTV